MSSWGIVAKVLWSKAKSALSPKPPIFELSRAQANNKNVTAITRNILESTNGGRSREIRLKRRLLIYYRYMGSGYYVLYYNVNDKLVFPPSNAPLAPMAIENLVISANVGARDITEQIVMLAGPDGLWNGRINPRDSASHRNIDLRILCTREEWEAGESIHIIFADCTEVTMNLKEKTQ